MYNKILIGQSTQVLDQGFIQLVDYMGTDDTIIQAARVSFGNEELVREVELEAASEVLRRKVTSIELVTGSRSVFFFENGAEEQYGHSSRMFLTFSSRKSQLLEELKTKDEVLLRLLMRHNHGTPFEMCEVMFRVQVPMDCWRQWIRHRTANVNEYSTRYTEAIDAMQCTAPDQWRLQSKDNKQGSSGFLEQWPERWEVLNTTDYLHDTEVSYGVFNKGILVHHCPEGCTPGSYLSQKELQFQQAARELYQERLRLGVAKEQARKDLPLSTYTRAYWKCDLRNIFHFLSLRMDFHAQLEIRQYANAMADFIKQLYPVAYKAFEDYQLNAVKFSATELRILKETLAYYDTPSTDAKMTSDDPLDIDNKPDSMTKREWNEFKSKLGMR